MMHLLEDIYFSGCFTCSYCIENWFGKRHSSLLQVHNHILHSSSWGSGIWAVCICVY